MQLLRYYFVFQPDSLLMPPPVAHQRVPLARINLTLILYLNNLTICTLGHLGGFSFRDACQLLFILDKGFMRGHVIKECLDKSCFVFFQRDDVTTPILCGSVKFTLMNYSRHADSMKVEVRR